MRRYTVIVYEDDGAYTASVPSLVGCVTQGDTAKEALENARDAIRLYIEDLEASGEPVPEEHQHPEMTLVEV